MNKAIQENLSKYEGTIIYRKVMRLFLGAMLVPASMVAGADESFQNNALLNPSEGQLMAEARGRIMIYDGLDNEVVDRALDEQYGRIENMMFVRIQHTQPDSEVSIEDDGC